MKYAVTLPGKIGDILWALPTVREVAWAGGEKVALVIPQDFSGLVELLEKQEYVEEVIVLDQEQWPIRYDAPIQPWYPSVVEMDLGYEKILHLGHSGWPEYPLYTQYWVNLMKRYPEVIQDFMTARIDGPDMKPWIQADPYYSRWLRSGIYYGMSEQWIELKAGVLVALADKVDAIFIVPGAPGGRHLEFDFISLGKGSAEFVEAGWTMSAELMASCSLYVGCCSSQWVLACSMGVPVVLFDPDPGRHNPIFWWDGEVEGRKWLNEKVLGGDGQPTFDARAVVEVVNRRLGELE